MFVFEVHTHTRAHTHTHTHGCVPMCDDKQMMLKEDVSHVMCCSVWLLPYMSLVSVSNNILMSGYLFLYIYIAF